MTENISGKEKALIFLSTLGDEVSAKVLRCLPDKISGRITAELNNFPKPSPEAIALVFKELSRFTLTRPEDSEKPRLQKPGQNEAQNRKNDQSDELVDSDAEVEHLDALSQFGRLSARELLALLQGEHAQTIAFILSYMTEARRDSFYELLSPGRRNDIKNTSVVKVPLSNRVFENLNEEILVHQGA